MDIDKPKQITCRNCGNAFSVPYGRELQMTKQWCPKCRASKREFTGITWRSPILWIFIAISIYIGTLS